MKNKKRLEAKDRPDRAAKPRPEHGAASQLHCYNAASWRLQDLLGADDDEPDPPKPKK